MLNLRVSFYSPKGEYVYKVVDYASRCVHTYSAYTYTLYVCIYYKYTVYAASMYTYHAGPCLHRAVVTMEDIGVHPGMSFPKHTFGEQDTVANATWAVSTAGEKYAFLLILLDNVYRQSEKYILVAQNE